MFIIESVTKSGVIMRQTIRRSNTMLPIMRARTSVETKDHRHIRVMTSDGQSLFDIGAALEQNYDSFRVAEPAKPKLQVVA